ncbi:MAG: amidohydrolase family protein [Arcicella sp.]|nr:amidohydrolase family protein [Arcicella sp.]
MNLFVKLQLEDSQLPENVFYEIQKQANLQKIKVLGHLSYNVDIGTVLNNKYSTIEHAWALIPHFVKQKKRFEKDLEIKKYELANQDSLLTQSVLRQIRENNTFYVPTHVASNRKETLVFDKKITQNSLNRYIEGTQLKLWKLWAKLHTSGYDKPEQQKILKEYYERGLAVTKLAQANGVKIMAGTDALDRYIYHGFSLHDELQEMVKAGLTNADALRTATVNPAEYYGKSAVLGNIEVGKKADMMLLSANPLENIAHTKMIESVYFNQKLYKKDDLEAMKNYVHDQANSFRINCRFVWNMIKGLI